MIGIDTNILVRYIVQDDKQQAALAASVLNEQCTREQPGWINRIVLCELVWVLESAYRCSRDEIAATLSALLQTAELETEDPDLVWQAIQAYESNQADFADALLFASNHRQGCRHTLTLDRKAARLPTGAPVQ